MVPLPSLLSYMVPVLGSSKGSIPSASALMNSLVSATLMRGVLVLEHVEPEF